nr:DNA-directed DNA polymerase [Tanacetum cinerariifolium]
SVPHHEFTELAQIDTFYNGLNDNDQDSLNAAAGGNLLSKTTKEALQIIENKSKGCYSRNKPNVSRMNTTSRENASKTDDRIDKLADQILTLVDIFAKKVVAPAPVKAVEESCVTCGGAHVYYNCPNTDSNQSSVCVVTSTYNQEAPQNRASNYMALPGFAPNQSSTSGTLQSNTITNPNGKMKSIITRSGVAYEGPSIPTPKKDKLFELAKIPLNENYSAMLLKKLPEKLGDPGKFLIPCDFLRMDGSDFILEEIEACFKDESISLEINHADCDPEGDICLIKKLLNNVPFQLPPIDLKQGEVVKAKYSIEESSELEFKDLPSQLEYTHLEAVDKLPVIISKDLKVDEKEALLKVFKSHKRAIAWKITDIKGIDPQFCTHKILMEEDYKPNVQSQRQVNLKIHEVIKKEVIKLLDAGMIYPISDSPWVSPIHCVPKKGGITVVKNETISIFLHGNEFYCFLAGFFGYFQIPINPLDRKRSLSPVPMEHLLIAECPLAFAMLLGHFQRCMMEILHDMIEKTIEVFMDDFSVFGDLFSSCLSYLDTMLQWCEDTNLVLNWEKCHFMIKEGIVLGHKISKNGLEVDRAKVDVIA